MSGQVDEHEESESIFTSVADLLVGFLFVFLILLTYFALQFKTATAALLDVNDAKQSILRQLEQRLNGEGLPARAEPQLGVLRLPEDVLFPKGSATLSPAGEAAMGVIAKALQEVLGCQLDGGACPPDTDRVETVLIEGHTDKDPLSSAARYRDNWDLSSARAFATYNAMVAAQPALAMARSSGSAGGQSLFGVSGYGPDRPVADGDDEASKRLNRRIDIRILMEPPEPPQPAAAPTLASPAN